MERDSFPTLTKSTTGWPVLTVDWGHGLSVEVEVCEETDGPGAVVVVRSGVPVSVEVDAPGQSAVPSVTTARGGTPGGGGGGQSMSASSYPHHGSGGGGR